MTLDKMPVFNPKQNVTNQNDTIQNAIIQNDTIQNAIIQNDTT
jgi:hypothetical protein